MADKREILFRGKRADNGRWIEGYHGVSGGGFILIDDGITCGGFEMFGVISETACQYTGLDDKNGKKIFEGDIIVIEDEDDDGIFVVKWDTDTARFVMDADGWTADFDSYNGYDCEVIGNIFDNPELVGEGDESVSYG